MGYINQTLTESERILAEARFDWRERFDILLPVVLAVASALFVLAWGKSPWWHMASALFLVWFLARLVSLLTTEMAATNRRVVLKTGWIARRTKELRMDAVETAHLTQGVFGRIFRCRAKLRVSGRGAEVILFKNITPRSALALKAAIEEAGTSRG